MKNKETNTGIFRYSDHGNIEAMNERGHTLNPVPFIVFGPGEGWIRDRVSSLADVTPAILEAFDK